MERYPDRSYRKIIRKCLYNIINHPSQIAKYFTNIIQSRQTIIRPLDHVEPKMYENYGFHENPHENLGYFNSPRTIFLNMDQSELELEKTIIHELQHYNYYHNHSDYDTDEDEKLAQLSELEYENCSQRPYHKFIKSHIKKFSRSLENKEATFNINAFFFILILLLIIYFL